MKFEDKELEAKVDKALDNFKNLVLSQKIDSEEWQHLRHFYAEFYGCTFINNGIRNKRFIPCIDIMPEGYKFGLKKNNNKAVKIQCVETGEIYQSYSDVARAMNCFSGSISNVIDKDKTFNGYHFKKIV